MFRQVLAAVLLVPSLAMAGGAAFKQLPANIQRLRTTPLKLSAANAAAHQAQLKRLMISEIEGKNGFEIRGSDTPVMNIVPLGGSLRQTKIAAIQTDYDHEGGHGAEFVAEGLARGQKMKVRLLLPVSAHYGLPYKQYAKTNEYEVWVEDVKTGKKLSSGLVKANGNLVTEYDVELPLDKAEAVRVSFTPTATSKGGFTSGREIIVRRGK